MNKNIFAVLLVCVMLAGCGGASDSFSTKETHSYDNAYYAVCETDSSPDFDMEYAKVSIYSADDDSEPVFSFYPAEADGFGGVCWESGSYNIWTQSELGVYCYRYDLGRWVLDETAERPADIVSKYDK